MRAALPGRRLGTPITAASAIKRVAHYAFGIVLLS